MTLDSLAAPRVSGIASLAGKAESRTAMERAREKYGGAPAPGPSHQHACADYCDCFSR